MGTFNDPMLWPTGKGGSDGNVQEKYYFGKQETKDDIQSTR